MLPVSELVGKNKMSGVDQSFDEIELWVEEFIEDNDLMADGLDDLTLEVKRIEEENEMLCATIERLAREKRQLIEFLNSKGYFQCSDCGRWRKHEWSSNHFHSHTENENF